MPLLTRAIVTLAVTLALALALPLAAPARADDANPDQSVKRLILPGESFLVDGHPAFIMWPEKEKRRDPQPWVFYGPTLPAYPDQAEKWMHEKLLAAGVAVAGIDIGEAYGSPASVEAFTKLYDVLTERRGFSKRPCMLGRSRGGLWVSSWAIANPDKVAGIAGIYPVYDWRTYPGVDKAAPAYGMTPEQLMAKQDELNPVARLDVLARAKIPVYIIHGDNDTVVPLAANSGELMAKYKAAGAGDRVTLNVAAGQGHSFWEGFFRCQPLVDFAIARALGEPYVPTPVAHWSLDDAGEKAADSVGGHDGVVHGATSVQGKVGRALLFDRSKSDHVAIAYDEAFKLHTFTVAAWVKLTKEPTFSGILGTRFGGEFTFDMKVNDAKVHGDIGDGERWIETKVNFYADDTGSNREGGDLAVGRWYHIAYVIDNDAKVCRLYLNGDLKKRIDFEGEPVLMTSGRVMHIGNSSTDEFMDGVIDEVKIWNVALTDEQVAAEAGTTAAPTSDAATPAVPDKLVVLTFDDSVVSQATFVAPLLKKLGFGATFYITEGFEFADDKTHYMTWQQIRKLHDDGFEIGNHTRSHATVPGLSAERLLDEVEHIEKRCVEHGIPRPVTFCYPAYQTSGEAVKLLRQRGYLFARTGGARAFDPRHDNPLLMPQAFDSKPGVTLERFAAAVANAKDGKIAVITFHGVPDIKHPWVNTERALFEQFMQHLRDHGYTAISVRDMAKYLPTAKAE